MVGADRVARNGDVANKIGTYGVACLSRMHQRPFYVAAPWSTFDLSCESGEGIPIEQRDPREISEFSRAGQRHRLVAEGALVQNPAFDVTPAAYVTSLFTERGVISPVSEATIAALSASTPEART